MSKKAIVFYTLGGILLFLVLVIRNAPAAFVLGHASSLTKAFTAFNTAGTVWKGEARIVVNQGRTRLDLGNVSWDLSGWSLLVGNVNVSLNAEKPGQNLSGDFSLSLLSRSLDAENVEAGFDLALIKQFAPVPGQISGFADINLPKVAADLNTLQLTELEGNVVVKDLVVNFAGEVVLGTYGARLELADNPNGEELIVVANVNDIDAHVAVNGKADVLPSTQAYYLDVNLTPKESANQMIANTLKQFYRAQADGSYNVRFGKALR